jgi:dephospho-CoA kinase
MTFTVGLTGSIGMGKSTAAAMFADEGIPVWSADDTVHRLYAPGQPAALAIAAMFPAVMKDDGSVDRQSLRQMIAADPALLDKLNAAVHPLVQADRAAFLARNAASDIVLLDIPLLFETGAERICDTVIVVTVPPEEQRRRVRLRGLTDAEIDMILSRQMPDADKRQRADHVIFTTSLDTTRAAIRDILQQIRKRIQRHA